MTRTNPYQKTERLAAWPVHFHNAHQENIAMSKTYHRRAGPHFWDALGNAADWDHQNARSLIDAVLQFTGVAS
jgi:hypothetical protein